LKIAQKLSFPGLNANRLEILSRVQDMAFYVLSSTFIVSAKILLSSGVKSVNLDFWKNSTFSDAFFCCNLAKTGLTLKRRIAMNS